jgi:acetyl esterase
VLLYLHGGGFVIGGLETHDSLCRQLALRSGGAVLALDYRLAPGAPLSGRGGRHLGRAALAGRAGAAALGLDGSAWPWAATAPAARWPPWRPACPRHRPAAGAATADHARHRRPCRHAVAPAVRQRLPARRGMPSLVLRPHIDHHHRSDWRFAPLLADDLDGVAPACVLLAECDPLVDEGLAYADRLRMPPACRWSWSWCAALTHDFIKMGRALKEAGQAQQAAADACALPGQALRNEHHEPNP